MQDNTKWESANSFYRSVVKDLKSLDDDEKEYTFGRNGYSYTIYLDFERHYIEVIGGEPDELLSELSTDYLAIKWYDVYDEDDNEVDDSEYEEMMDTIEQLYNNTKL
jgi:hypothetical protein